MIIFELLKQIKEKEDPYNYLRFHQFMFNLNKDYMENNGKNYRVFTEKEMFVKDLYFEKDDQYISYLKNRLKEKETL